jgi:ABC-type uncharacterized transport system ATPase subunit
MSVQALIDILESDDRISGWQVRELAKQSTQLFLNKDAEESRRRVDSLAFDVELLITRKAALPGQKEKQWVTGNARFNVDPGALGRFKGDLETAIASANLVSNEAYGMAEVAGTIPKVELADPALMQDAEGQVALGAEQLRHAAAKEKGVRLVAAEFFADRFRTRYFNSQGVNCLFESTLYSGEYCLLAAGPKGETEVFKAYKRRRLQDVGLDYLKLGQSATTLSGGEAQRIKLAKELSRRATGRTLYILDEPTTGLHFEDVRKLLELLQALVKQGNTVLVIEHNLDVLKSVDHIVDIGPDGGIGGGKVVAKGTPEDIAKEAKSFTGQFLKTMLK